MNKKLSKSATIRFYEELNDFLPAEKKKSRFTFSFTNQPSIKDAIESLGIPHTEVDLILVNGTPVTFNYLLHDQDDIAVYPVFESIDISAVTLLRKQPLRRPKFILDVHLGKLARLMRLFGLNVRYQNLAQDKEIIAQALKEKRIILTRDVGLLKNKRITHGYWVRTTQPKKQILEILKRFDLFSKIKTFSRCLECNTLLTPLKNKKLLDDLLPQTKKYFQEFYFCKSCKKIYWKGSHFDKLKKLVDDTLKKI